MKRQNNLIEAFDAIKSNEEYSYQLARINYFVFVNLIDGYLSNFTYFQDWQRLVVSELQDFIGNNDLFYIANLAPRTGKTQLITVLGIAWLIGQNPKNKILLASASKSNIEEVAIQIRAVMESKVYKAIFPEVRLSRNAMYNLRTMDGGGMWSCVAGSNVTGRGFNYMFFDDFLNPKHISSDAEMRHAIINFGGFLGRKEYNPRTKIFIVEQRIGLHDITSTALKFLKNSDIPYKHISLPYQFTTDQTYKTFKFKAGNFLDSKFDENDKKVIIATRCSHDHTIFETQYQQNPINASGDIIKEEDLQNYVDMDTIAEMLIGNKFQIYISCDTAYETKKQNDYSAIIVFGVFEGNIYCLNVIRVKLEYPQLKEKIADTISEYSMYGGVRGVLIEQASSGRSLVQDFKNGFTNRRTGRQEYTNILAIKVDRDKVVRMNYATPFFRAKRFILPSGAHWLPEFKTELLEFPNGLHDDQCDAVSQMIYYWQENQFKPSIFIT